jgi:transcriptional regulator with XRE-family HTH domain
MDDQERRRQLAHFLRTRRERLSPEQVGLPTGPRRRTLGLRREELALLAGMGATWYTRLEQGRDIRVSAQVLESLVRVLHLDAEERNHLFILAHEHLPADSSPLTVGISSSLQYILDTVGICPAYVIGPNWDMLGWNQAMCCVYADFDAMSTRERNVLWFLFTNPRARALLVDWQGDAQRALALFRASTGHFVGERWFTTLVTDLKQMSPEFREWWPRHDVQRVHTGKQELNHPVVGRLVLQSTTLQVIDHPNGRLIVYTPLREEDTEQKLVVLTGSASTGRDLPQISKANILR